MGMEVEVGMEVGMGMGVGMDMGMGQLIRTREELLSGTESTRKI